MTEVFVLHPGPLYLPGHPPSAPVLPLSSTVVLIVTLVAASPCCTIRLRQQEWPSHNRRHSFWQ